jgi:hypothetical protein
MQSKLSDYCEESPKLPTGKNSDKKRVQEERKKSPEWILSYQDPSSAGRGN